MLDVLLFLRVRLHVRAVGGSGGGITGESTRADLTPTSQNSLPTVRLYVGVAHGSHPILKLTSYYFYTR